MLAHHAPQQIPAARDGVADRECERLAEAVVVHGAGRAVKALAIRYNERMIIRLATLALVMRASPALALLKAGCLPAVSEPEALDILALLGYQS